MEVTDTDLPLYLPVMVLYSLLSATNVAESKCSAINSTLPGSPGNITKSDTSPFLSWTWYCIASFSSLYVSSKPPIASATPSFFI